MINICIPPFPPKKRLHFRSKCREEIVEVHHLEKTKVPRHILYPIHRVHPCIEESSKASVPSSNEPGDHKKVHKDNATGANLGPHQVWKGMMPWWKTWRKERWVNFFFSTKKMESAKSMNLEK